MNTAEWRKSQPSAGTCAVTTTAPVLRGLFFAKNGGILAWFDRLVFRPPRVFERRGHGRNTDLTIKFEQKIARAARLRRIGLLIYVNHSASMEKSPTSPWFRWRPRLERPDPQAMRFDALRLCVIAWRRHVVSVFLTRAASLEPIGGADD